MKTGMRRIGRELAIKILFSLNHSELELNQVFDDFWQNFSFSNDVLGEALDADAPRLPAGARNFAEELVVGVVEHGDEVDAALATCAANWTLERMGMVDLAILRLAAYEIIHRPDIPVRVALNEAIELGKRFGAKETPAFVNGILDRIAQQHRTKES